MKRNSVDYYDERLRRAMLQVGAYGTLSAHCGGCGLPLCPTAKVKGSGYRGFEPCCRDAKVIRP